MRAKCGTYAGYQVHVKAKEPTCHDCKRANRNYNNKRRRRQNGWREFSYADLRQFATGADQ